MIWWLSRICVFFFQAEDGIRDLVRSRGLGDVYKRQKQDTYINGAYAVRISEESLPVRCPNYLPGIVDGISIAETSTHIQIGHTPVSYTHLTLPTSDLV